MSTKRKRSPDDEAKLILDACFNEDEETALLYLNNKYSYIEKRVEILRICVLKGLEKVLTYLVQNNANLYISENKNLFSYLTNENEFMIDVLLKSGLSILDCNRHILHIGLKLNKMLLERGANPNIRDNLFRYPLSTAICSGLRKHVKLLLDFGADPTNCLELCAKVKDKDHHCANYCYIRDALKKNGKYSDSEIDTNLVSNINSVKHDCRITELVLFKRQESISQIINEFWNEKYNCNFTNLTDIIVEYNDMFDIIDKQDE